MGKNIQNGMGPANETSGKQVMLQFVYLAVSLVGSGLLMKWATSQLDPNKENKKKAQQFKKALQRRLGVKIETDGHEDAIAMDIANPQSIDVTLKDIGGHQDTKKILNMKVILPLQQPAMFNSYLLRQPKGVLLYGPPGTGKTMLAKPMRFPWIVSARLAEMKQSQLNSVILQSLQTDFLNFMGALAKEAGARFIAIKASSLQSKWFGETQKLVQAVFSLAYKLQPTIIFIDEVDALLGKRREQEHEAITTMKTEFMQLWDGFNTDASANVMVLAATNRPFDLDDAVLRRFTLQLEVGMPDAVQREAILGLILRKHARSHIGSPSVDVNLLNNRPAGDGRRPQAKIAEQTDGFNGSDLLELCSRAASVPIQECMERQAMLASTSEPSEIGAAMFPREVQLSDFVQVLRTFKPATHAAEAYRQSMEARSRHGSPGVTDTLTLLQTLAHLANGQMGAAGV